MSAGSKPYATKAFSIKLIAIAAVISPIILVNIFKPLLPKTLEISLPPYKKKKQRAKTTASATPTIKRPTWFVR